jgi:hypothetical protein
MRVRIIEKMYHMTNNPNLATPRRRQKEDYWIRELGIVFVRLLVTAIKTVSSAYTITNSFK